MPALSNKRRERFAQAVAAGVDGLQAYASAGFDTSNRTNAVSSVGRLRRDKSVSARIEELKQAVAHTVEARMAVAIAASAAVEADLRTRLGRVKILEERRLKLVQICAERAVDPDHQSVPGGSTGLMIVRKKMVGRGEQRREVVTSRLDTALLSELREHERRIAQELGQEIDRKQVDVSFGEILERTPAEQVQAEIQRLEEQKRIAGVSEALIIDVDAEVVEEQDDDEHDADH